MIYESATTLYDADCAYNQLDPTAPEIAASVLVALQAGIIPANIVQVRGQTIGGSGSEQDPWGP